MILPVLQVTAGGGSSLFADRRLSIASPRAFPWWCRAESSDTGPSRPVKVKHRPSAVAAHHNSFGSDTTTWNTQSDLSEAVQNSITQNDSQSSVMSRNSSDRAASL